MTKPQPDSPERKAQLQSTRRGLGFHWWALLCLIFMPAIGGAKPVVSFDKFGSKHLTGSVNSILQDQVGFLWFGTQGGLVRYDGQRFVPYSHDPGDPQTLSNNNIRALLEDSSGDLWVGTQSGGVSRWHRSTNRFSHFRHDDNDPQSLAKGAVSALFQDHTGALWVGTSASGLNRLDPTTGDIVHFRHDPTDPHSLGSDNIQTIFEDRHGVLWLGTGTGLNRFDRDTETFRSFQKNPQEPPGPANDTIRSIFEDSGGTLWIGTLDYGLYRFDRETGEFKSFELPPADVPNEGEKLVRAMTEDRDGRLWVGTDGGLLMLDRAAGKVLRFRHDAADVRGLSANRVAAVYQDRGGILWIGTQGGGVNKTNPLTWRSAHQIVEPTQPSNPATTNVLAISQDPQGDWWVGTSGGGLHHLTLDGQNRQYVADSEDPGSLSDNSVTALLHDHQERLWIGTFSGLDRLDPGQSTFIHYRHDGEDDSSLGSDGVTKLFEDSRSRLWIGTHGGGLNRFEDEGRFVRFHYRADDETSLSGDQVTTIAEDVDGHLWVGTLSAGLNYFTPSADGGTAVRLQRDHDNPASLASDQILALHVDEAGTLWVGTQSGGLHKLESFNPSTGQAKFRRYLEDNGLPNNTVYGIVPEAGKLWLSTDLGLSRLDPETETFVNYNVFHGLQSNEFNMGAYGRSRDGRVLFGGINGFNAFRSDDIQRNDVPPKIALTSFSKMGDPVTDLGHPIYDLQEVRLDYDESIFSFEFAALDFWAPEENSYRYRFGDWDGVWVELGNHPQVRFNNLEPGHYELLVQAANNDGVWNEEGRTLKILINPPWWQTWWFRIIAFLVLSSLIFMGVKARMTQITKERLQVLVEERTQELEEAQEQLFRRKKLAVLGELAGSVAHELRNPLGAIRNNLYLMKLKPPDASSVKTYCARIDHEVGRSDRIITELLDWGRDTPADLRPCVLQEIVATALEDTKVPDSITVENRLATEPVNVDVDAGQIRRIVQNFLQNAVEAMHSNGQLIVTVREADGEACAEVTDSGIGIPPEKIERIFEPLVSGKAKGVGLGLPLSLRYAERNHGRIECESTVGVGSTFRLLLPLAA